jgi:hypothetical protein
LGRAGPKSVSFGEVARDGVARKRSGSALTWRQGIGHEGGRDQRRRLGAEHKGLRTRGLAVGSSQLPWAHIKLVTRLEPVKGLAGLDSGGACSRDARSSSDRAIPRPDTVAPRAVRRRAAGGGGKPADSIARPPTAERNAGTRAGDTGVAAPADAARAKPGLPTPRSRTPRVPVRMKCARVSAQRTIPDFFAATVLVARSTSHAPDGARVSGSAARLAVRRCGA